MHGWILIHNVLLYVTLVWTEIPPLGEYKYQGVYFIVEIQGTVARYGINIDWHPWDLFGLGFLISYCATNTTGATNTLNFRDALVFDWIVNYQSQTPLLRTWPEICWMIFGRPRLSLLHCNSVAGYFVQSALHGCKCLGPFFWQKLPFLVGRVASTCIAFSSTSCLHATFLSCLFWVVDNLMSAFLCLHTLCLHSYGFC